MSRLKYETPNKKESLTVVMPIHIDPFTALNSRALSIFNLSLGPAYCAQNTISLISHTLACLFGYHISPRNPNPDSLQTCIFSGPALEHWGEAH